MGLLSRIFSPSAVKHVEGEAHPGPWLLPITGGWLPASVGQYWNWWQLGYNPSAPNMTAMVEACVSAYAQTIAMCPGDHWRTEPDGGRQRVANSALSRILRKPNDYQTISDFLLNVTRCLYLEGNAYALAVRNDRFEISELHLFNPRQSSPRLAVTGDVFYNLGGNEIIEKRLESGGFPSTLLAAVPARDVLHIRLHTPRHPLQGETPLEAAMLDIAASNAMTAQQVAFYANQARPSQVLSTDQVLTADQVKQLRELWNEHSQGLNAGKTPILSAGLKPLMLATSSRDAQLADMMKLTEQHIALVFRVPLQILGIGGTPFASTEALMQSWIATGLGFAINHIEEGIGRVFGLRGYPDEYVEFDTAALLRSSMAERIDALARGVQGGVYSPNEARRWEGLPAAKDGDEPRVQQQVVPLSFGAKPPEPAPLALPAPQEDDANGDDERGFAHAILAAADEYDRRAA